MVLNNRNINVANIYKTYHSVPECGFKVLTSLKSLRLRKLLDQSTFAYWALLDLSDLTWLYWALLSLTGFFLASLGLLSHTGPYLALLGLTWP